MPRMELGLLGGFRARLSPGDVLVLPTRKAQAVLAYLAVPAGATHPRDKIAALLWGDMSQRQARGNLRQVLAALRRALGSTGALRLEGESIALDPARISVDVARFEACAGTDDPGTLAEAARLYEGDFLAGLTLQEPPFEEWLLGQRERLRETAMDVIARLLAHQRRAGDLEAAVQSALKLLTLDPLQEPVHRTLMRLYVQLGRRGAALRQYQVCVTALDRELRTQPEPETKTLYQQILTERPAPPAAIADPQAAARLTTPSPTTPAVAAGSRPLDIPATDIPLVGREREMARLTELLEAVWSGRGQLVALLGDPGVGKSRLAAEVVALAARRGARILVGRCFESEQRLPFGVWVDALRRGDVLAGEALMGALGSVWRGELARLLPELGEPLPASREGSDPLHLFEAITRLVEQLAAREPVVILFEDAHWVDEMSLRLLSFMARRIRGWRVLWLGTLREEEVASDPRHRRMGDELAREGLAVRLHLPPLSRSDTIALGRQLLPPGTAESVDEQVWRASEGNAFIAVETARTLADARRGERLPGELVPGRVRELVDGRLARLSPRSRRIVDLAATIGRQFEFSLLERASGIPEDEAAEAMEELVRRRIIQQSGDGFEFTHDRVREVAYAGLLLPQRGILHRRVAEALEALHGPGDPDAAAALAFHYRQARAWPRAVHHLGRFAEQAARGYAHGDAAEALGHALDALAHTPASPERDREELRLALRRAQSLYFVGHWPESVEVLVARSALLVRVDDPSLSGPWHAWLGNIYVRLGQLEQARDSARRAIEEAARAGDDATSGKAHGVLSFEAFWGGRPRDGVALGERAAALLETTAERWWEAMAHFYTAFNDGQLGRLARARASLARLRAIGEAIADNRLCNYAAWTTGWTEALEGRQAAAVGSCERALELATDPVSAAYAAAFLGYAYLESGDADRAAPRLAQAVGDYQTFRFRPAEAWFGALLADARRLQGRHDEAAGVAMRAGAVARDLGFPFAGALAQRALGRALWARGAKDDADRMLAEAAQTFRAIEAELEAARTLLDLAAVAAARDDVARARTLARSARSAFIQLDVPVHVARADEALARLV